ncbi:MAG: radical SAM protein [Ruminococcaceae bacterium]|nr:radical SAM protein [Oscillospiraceae bacterium]
MGAHSNISFFVPHLGCKNRCSFCNQNSITGSVGIPTKEDIVSAVKIATQSARYDAKNTEIAFFGGSFTAIDRSVMEELLSFAYPYVKNKTVKGIRISTRPDAIDKDVLLILKKYGVTSIELGAQSTDEMVLDANNRGHSLSDIENASLLIKEHGFSLGLQMMTGLYKATIQSDMETVKKFIELTPDTVRIYPTVVLKNTYLAFLYKQGKYNPQSVNESVETCCRYYNEFTKNGIKVIRLGLHQIDKDDYVAGPWHPAFSQLCLSSIYAEKLKEKLSCLNTGKYTVKVNKSEISTFVGQKKINVINFKNMGYILKFIGEENIPVGKFILERDVK